MSDNTATTTVDSELSMTNLLAMESGQSLTVPVSVTETGMKLETSDDDSVVVLGVEVENCGQYLDGEVYELTGTVGTTAAGTGGTDNYLVFRNIESFGPTGRAAGNPEAEESANDSNNEKMSERPTFSTGKTIRTDKGNERLAGKNPFADPDRLKEAGLHQGGI